MTYLQTYTLLKGISNSLHDTVTIPDYAVEMVQCPFISASRSILPGAHHYSCAHHGVEFPGEQATAGDGLPPHTNGLSLADAELNANSEFRYTIFKPAGKQKAEAMILLLHGLNERHWHKYLPWALKLVELTGSAVCLFPIAFHMNRAPTEWSSPKSMNMVAEERKQHFRSIAQSSFANAAISTRMQNTPQRFFWSGVQTYNDIIQLVEEVRGGRHSFIAATAHINFFAYSIGSFLAQIMLMANRNNAFTSSKLFIFCGGPTFDRMYPVSKYIIDSEAMIALYAFYVEHLENEFKRDTRLAHFFTEGHSPGEYFRAMLAYRKLKDVRERRLNELSESIRAIALARDEVIQPNEVLNTLKGDFHKIPIQVQIQDFPFEYSHVSPFPALLSIQGEVDRSFNNIFEQAASFLMTD